MGNRKNVILIADIDVNDSPICSGLQADHDVLQARNFDEGLKLFSEELDRASVVLIDMEIALSGERTNLGLLREKREDREFPIVIIAPHGSEQEKLRCLELGASDFICSSMNAALAVNRIANMIKYYDIGRMCTRVAREPVSGAYNRYFFMDMMMQRIRSDRDTQYDLVCLEMESYDMLQGRYGEELCDMFMSTMVKSLGAILPEDTIMGRIDTAHVVFLMQHIPFEFHAKMMKGCVDIYANSPFPFFVINAGVYTCTDPDLSPEEIYNNTILAIEGIRYDYTRFIAEFDESISKKMQHLKFLKDNMNAALAEKQFKVYYQPKYNTSGDCILGAEALVRWIHPELGFMSPGDFIPLFEKNGFIFELDKYILEAVCIDIRKWLDMGIKVVPVSVNISQTDFDQVTLETIFENIVDKYGIPHELVHFEITETSNAPDEMKKQIIVDGLRKRGFKVELDDFGAGFSTLSILKSIPVDVMKIDMSLVRNIFEPRGRAILEGAVFTAKRLGIDVVVEGVENDEQYNALIELCEGYIEPEIQGFYFSKPLPSEVYEKKLLS